MKRKQKGSNTKKEGGQTERKQKVQQSDPTIFEKIYGWASTAITWTIRGTVGVLMIGFLFNLAYLRYEKFTLQPLGEFVEVGEKVTPLNYYCTGSKSSDDPTIFIVPGSDTVFLPYGFLIKRLSQTYRVCTYDRHGRLFSGGKANNTNAEFNVNNLHKVITTAIGDSSNVILVGHSLGGLLAASYSLEYPVGGLVLLDTFGTSSNQLVDEITKGPKEAASWAHFMTVIGMIRATTIYDPYQYYRVIPNEWSNLWLHCINQPEYWSLDEMSLWAPLQSFLQNKTAAGTKLNIPVFNIRSSKFDGKTLALWQELWKNETLLTQSLSSKPITTVEIPDSDHTFLDKHNEVTEQINRYVKTLLQTK